MATDSEIARLGVLRTFEWLDGDAVLTPVFKDADVLASLGPGLAEPFRDSGVTAVVAPEARGFVLGALCAVSLGVGFVAARKPGAPRPGDRVQVTSEPDWRGRRITFQVSRVFGRSDRILLVDDWIETGSQASAIAGAVAQMGATLAGTSVIVDSGARDNPVGAARRWSASARSAAARPLTTRRPDRRVGGIRDATIARASGDIPGRGYGLLLSGVLDRHLGDTTSVILPRSRTSANDVVPSPLVPDEQFTDRIGNLRG